MSNSSKTLTSLLLGAAVGVAIGYFLNSEKKDELMQTVRDQAQRLKEKAGKLKQKMNSAVDEVDS